MNCSRRNFGKLALGGIPLASAILADPRRFFAAQAKPNSYINGVQIGVITYSFRSMPDQSAEATLGYITGAGLSACELMNGPCWDYAYKRSNFTPPGRGGAGGGGGRGAAGAGRGTAGGPATEQVAAVPGPAVPGEPSYDGKACPAGAGGRGAGRGAAGGGAAAAGASGAPGGAEAAGAGAARGGGGRGGRGEMTPEQQQAQAGLQKFQLGVSLDIFKDLKKMYNDAGVSIYAVKILEVNAPDELLDKQFQIGKTLGATHLTAELVPHSDTSTATLKKVGDAALRNGMHAAYHTHTQGSITAFDEAFAASEGNWANVDFGHYVAAGEKGGTPMDFLNKFHGRIGSFHLKDRTTPEHCALNLPWGEGETPIKEILKLVQKNKWPIPATIEQEYQIPPYSDAVKEVAICLAYCRAALNS
jgi:sugar phosphate isomerase/epimerase